MLRANLAKEEGCLASLESERQEIEAALPDLVPEPGRYVEAQDRLREIEVLVPSKRCTVDAIRAAIPVAEKREAKDGVIADREEQGRKSAKVRRDLAARYSKAAEAFAAVLTEVEVDNRAWELINFRGREFDLPRQDSAERQVRKEAGVRPNGCWYSLTEGIVVRDWTGRVLFGGKVGTYF